jgi:transmembrane sensor
MDANDRRVRATDEATQWWSRLGTKAPADVSETDRQEFTQWLRESPLHVSELLQVAHVHDTLERFKLWDEISVSSEEIAANVIPLSQFKRPAAVRPPRAIHWAVAAGVSLIAVAAGWLALRSSATTLETDRAERREVVLKDGSVVNLEPETALRVNLGRQQRYIVLARGRALFHVAKDPTRPFIVHAGDTDVRAVGTIFGVEEKGQNIIVTVSEGKVAVVPSAVAPAALEDDTVNFPTPRGKRGGREGRLPAAGEKSKDKEAPVSAQLTAGDASSARVSAKGEDSTESGAASGEPSGMADGQPGEVFLTANQQITVLKSGDATPVQKVDSGRALAWSEGQLIFDSTPLSDVADEFNRYNRVQLHINSPELARRTVSGVFRASDPETLVEFIGVGAHVVVTRRGNEEIVISPGP